MVIRSSPVHPYGYKCCEFKFGFFDEALGEVDIYWCNSTDFLVVKFIHFHANYRRTRLNDGTLVACQPEDFIALKAWELLKQPEPKCKYRELL